MTVVVVLVVAVPVGREGGVFIVQYLSAASMSESQPHR